MLFSSENLCTNIICQNVHAEFLFRIFWHFEICFSIMGSFAPVSRNGYPFLSTLSPLQGCQKQSTQHTLSLPKFLFYCDSSLIVIWFGVLLNSRSLHVRMQLIIPRTNVFPSQTMQMLKELHVCSWSRPGFTLRCCPMLPPIGDLYIFLMNRIISLVVRR
jgi:hypothetical protein